MKNELKDLFTSYWKYLAINAACELRLFDKIKLQSVTVEVLCKNNNWDFSSVNSTIEICKTEGLLEQSTELKLAPKGELLTTDHPDNLLYACLHWADEHLNSWQNLSYTLRTGLSSFENTYGEQYFEYLRKRPDKFHEYHKAMFEYAIDDYKSICSIIDFSSYQSVMDVGGGYGALIKIIKEHNPYLDCFLFDLPEVINYVQLKNITKVPGNFFYDIVVKPEAIILSRVLHDWNDEKASVIINNCYQAIPYGGSIYIIEILADKLSEAPLLLNLNMAAICNSKERTFNEYLSLLHKGGFKYNNCVQLNELQSIIKAVK